MALFEVTAEIQILAKPITPGWHPAEVTKIEDSRSDDGVMKTTFTHKIMDGPHKNAMFWVTVHHDHRMAYAIQYLDFQTNGSFTKPVKAGEKAKKELTLANLAHKQFDAKIKNTLSKEDGRTMNNLQDQAKLGTKEYYWKNAKATAPAPVNA